MTRWKTEAHFASWLGLCPDNRISGDKVLARGTRHVINRAATALRMAATTLIKSQSYLGAQYRRLRTKLSAEGDHRDVLTGSPGWYSACSSHGQEYVDKGTQYYEQKHREQQLHLLKKKAATPRLPSR